LVASVATVCLSGSAQRGSGGTGDLWSRGALRGRAPPGAARRLETIDGNASRTTWNGCECASNWTLVGYPPCEGQCCDANGDALGAWCVVKDSACEDTYWGYCRPVDYLEVTGCRDDPPTWSDSEGDACAAYRVGQWCTSSGAPGPGWKADWGSFTAFAGLGGSAVDACCACGGGKRHESCIDDPNWVDTDGDTCDEYVQNNWCNADGTEGAGWHSEWGPMENSKATTSAMEACCGCGAGAANLTGGGNSTGKSASEGQSSAVSKLPTTAAPSPTAASAAGTLAPTPSPTTTTAAESNDVARVTFNGCQCRREWTDETGGACSSSCCNIDEDPVGDWCYVVDVNCEEASWGYCVPKGHDAMTTRGCADAPEQWRDSSGSTCAEYFYSEWCTAQGKPGAGWKVEWGSMADYAVSEVDASQACCICGGGGDQEEKPDACVDAPQWTDASGDTCASYELYRWCTATGYDIGWHVEEWGSFGNYSKEGISAAQACCACGGSAAAAEAVASAARPTSTTLVTLGPTTTEAVAAVAPLTTTTAARVPTTTPYYHARVPTTTEASRDAVARTTWNGCACKQTWIDTDGNSCDDYCCNPDFDARGSWCVVEERSCEGVEWGYCRPTTAAVASTCRNQPRGWTDAEGDSCTTYEAEEWCNADGSAGPKWSGDWGSLANYAKNGHTGLTSCCACGGGTTSTNGIAPGSLSEEAKAPSRPPEEASTSEAPGTESEARESPAAGGGSKVAMLIFAVVLGGGLGWYCYKQRAPGSASRDVPAAKYGRM